VSNPSTRNPQPAADDGNESELAGRRQAGALLRAAREAAGRSLSELASQLKVSADKISALESGDWSRLHDPAHARGLLRAAAKAVRADADAVLRPLPPIFVRGTPIVPAPGVTMGPVRPAEPVGTHGSSRRLVWLGVLVVVVALGLLFLPRSDRLGYVAQQLRALLSHHAGTPRPAGSGIGTGSTISSTISTTAASAAAAAQHPGSRLSSGPRPAASSSPAAQASTPASVPQARLAPASVAREAAAASAPAASASLPAGPPGPPLSLSASGQSWVRVRSQAGRVLFTGLLAAGGSRNVSTLAADFPLHLTVGNAAQTRVSLGGKPVALPAGGDNVARLVLKGAAP
jgi:cytoskeleton protein RodZ